MGKVEFVKEKVEGFVRVNGSVGGMIKGKKGLNVNEKGEIRNGWIEDGEKLKNENKNKGRKKEKERNVGDMGKIEDGNNGFEILNLNESII